MTRNRNLLFSRRAHATRRRGAFSRKEGPPARKGDRSARLVGRGGYVIDSSVTNVLRALIVSVFERVRVLPHSTRDIALRYDRRWEQDGWTLAVGRLESRSSFPVTQQVIYQRTNANWKHARRLPCSTETCGNNRLVLGIFAFFLSSTSEYIYLFPSSKILGAISNNANRLIASKFAMLLQHCCLQHTSPSNILRCPRTFSGHL